MHLDEIIPWGRSFDEYRRMFALSDDELGGSILGCADGPASFNAEATRRGSRIVSCDPIYRFERSQIQRRIAETYPDNLSAVLRVFVLEHEAERWAASVPRKDPWLRLNVSRAACGIPQGQRAGRG